MPVIFFTPPLDKIYIRFSVLSCYVIKRSKIQSIEGDSKHVREGIPIAGHILERQSQSHNDVFVNSVPGFEFVCSIELEFLPSFIGLAISHNVLCHSLF